MDTSEQTPESPRMKRYMHSTRIAAIILAGVGLVGVIWIFCFHGTFHLHGIRLILTVTVIAFGMCILDSMIRIMINDLDEFDQEV